MAVMLVEQPGFRLAGAEAAVSHLRDHTERALVRYGPMSENLLRKAAGAAERVYELMSGPATRPTAAAELSAALEMFPKLRLQGLVMRQVAAVYGALRVQLAHALEEMALCRRQLEAAAAALRAEDEQDAAADAGAAGYLLPADCGSLDEAADRLLGAVSREDRRAVDGRAQERLEAEFGGLAGACLTAGDSPTKLAARVRAAATELLAPRVGDADVTTLFLGRAADPAAARQVVADAYAAAAPALGATGLPELAAVALPPGDAADQVRAVVTEALADVGPVMTGSPDDIAVYRECPRVPLGRLPQLGAEAKEVFAEVSRAQGAAPHARADVVEWVGPR
jgi:hypothetical protein